MQNLSFEIPEDGNRHNVLKPSTWIHYWQVSLFHSFLSCFCFSLKNNHKLPRIKNNPLPMRSASETSKERTKRYRCNFIFRLYDKTFILKHWIQRFAVADPGFPVGGGANLRGGRQHIILPNCAKNCMKLRKLWAVGGGRTGAPPKSATALWYDYN